jgi:hypothetical protein
MEKTLAMSEIRERYPSEWVLIEEPRTDESLAIQGGVVGWHSKDRDEVYRKAALERRGVPGRRFAVIYTGEMVPGTAMAL